MSDAPLLSFDPIQHKYSLDGEELPSVTKILAPLHDFSGIPPGVLQHAADRGKAVHRAIELDCADNLEEESLHPEIVPYFHAWRAFVERWSPSLVASEQAVYHPTLKYAGTLDSKFIIKDELTYVDFKCTAKIPPTVGIQLGAYHTADLVMHGQDLELLRTQKRFVLWLKPDTTYAFLERPDTDWPLFLRLLSQYHSNRATQTLIAEWQKHHH